MSQEMQHCPNCDAYVISDDAICPRCTHSFLADLPVSEVSVRLPDKSDDGQASSEISGIKEEANHIGVFPVETEGIGAALDMNEIAENTVASATEVTQLDDIVALEDDNDKQGDAVVDTVAEEAVEDRNMQSQVGAPSVDFAASDPDADTSEIPTALYAPEEDSPGGPPITPAHQPADLFPPAEIVPPAPYIPPVSSAPPPAPALYGYQPVYRVSPAVAYFNHRVEAYIRGGYRLHTRTVHEATLTYGKNLEVRHWILALLSIIGVLWYWLLLALNGFRADAVYIVLENTGHVYEDGPGAAHTRQQRSRVGRRWGMAGLVMLVFSLFLILILGGVAGVFLTQERYQSALREAYPAITLIEERFSNSEADPSDVKLAKDGAVMYALVVGIAVMGLWSGVTMFVIGTIHAQTYRVYVPALPG